jgi:hypothetical protein
VPTGEDRCNRHVGRCSHYMSFESPVLVGCHPRCCSIEDSRIDRGKVPRSHS